MRIVLASNNLGKLKEIRKILQNSPYKILPQIELQVPEIEETGVTFIENALLKARNASKYSNLAALADDSGLVIDALQGAPGVYSARYAGKNTSSKENIAKVLSALEGVPAEKRSARFYCVMVYLRNYLDPVPVIAEGVWEGRILFAAEGTKGFGYDPIFFVPKYNCSAAQLSFELKNSVSHRGQALRKLFSGDRIG